MHHRRVPITTLLQRQQQRRRCLRRFRKRRRRRPRSQLQRGIRRGIRRGSEGIRGQNGGKAGDPAERRPMFRGGSAATNIPFYNIKRRKRRETSGRSLLGDIRGWPWPPGSVRGGLSRILSPPAWDCLDFYHLRLSRMVLPTVATRGHSGATPPENGSRKVCVHLLQSPRSAKRGYLTLCSNDSR